MKSPVLLLVFNRPDTTQKVFDAIRQAKPPRLYVVADGPREGYQDDIKNCQLVRDIVFKVDWSCELVTLFRGRNLGTKYGLTEAIDWFFTQEEEGIILEDDILPLPSFFLFCDEMLDRYRDSSFVSTIAGNNSISPYFFPDTSYFFSKYSFTWGWATWKRAWQNFDIDMVSWPIWKQQMGLKSIADGNRYFEVYWSNVFDIVYAKKLNTCWDYQWQFNNWKNKFVCIIPKYNLIENIGFGLIATHTVGNVPDYLVKAVPKEMEFPLVHSTKLKRSIKADQLFDKFVIKLTMKTVLLHRLRKSFMYPMLRKIKYCKLFKG